LQSVAAGAVLSPGAPPDFFSESSDALAMQEDAYPHVPRRLFHARRVLLFSLLLGGCGGGEDGTSRVVSSPALMAAAPQASPGTSRWAAQDASPRAAKSPSPAVTDGTAEPSLDAAKLAQLSALPHLSALSAREKAGLLLLLPSKSSSERMVLITMYPSLAQLPVQQKQVLLDKLEKIVPVTASQRR
jgi:hypothetical protein